MPKSRNEIYAERDAKYYTFKRIKVRKEWNYAAQLKIAADLAGESVNGFIIKATVDRARSLGVPFENGPFFDTEPAEADEQPDTNNNE